MKNVLKRMLIVIPMLLFVVCIRNVQAANYNYAKTDNMGVQTFTVQPGGMKEWSFDSITTDHTSPQEIHQPIQIQANTTGSTEDLQYKFVWMKNEWRQWGVIQDFSNISSTSWNPEEKGNYKLYVDVKGKDGKIESKNITYQITRANWSYAGVSTTLLSPQKPQTNIGIKANVDGNTTGLQYKFVWMKENWKNWGVISDFSDKSDAVFTPSEVGDYTLYVDVKDVEENTITTKTMNYEVYSYLWDYQVVTSAPSPQEKYCDPITITAVDWGETSNVTYKFVWMKDNWKNWGVLQDFSTQKDVVWTPNETGKYSLYVDAIDAAGRKKTIITSFEITNVKWSFQNISLSPDKVIKKGETSSITANATGTLTGLQYKFVWMKDNWKKWGVIQDFSFNKKAEWQTPTSPGNYTIYVDIKDRDNNIVTQKKEYFVASQIWSHDGLNINDGNQEQVYTYIPIKALTSGENDNLQYKFVWKYGNKTDDWSKGWGVISDYSSADSTSKWYPKKAGVYTLYSDIRDSDGRIQTAMMEYTVADAPWKLDSIDLSNGSSYFVGENATITANTSGETEGLQYKFVVRRSQNDWSDWEVLQDFDTNNTVTLPINKNINYWIYVNVKDTRGVVFDAETAVAKGYNYVSAGASTKYFSIGKSTLIYPNLYGPSACDAEYKYVWMKNNWSSWNVIKDFSSSTSATWTPTEEGDYYIYVDVKMHGVITTKSIHVTVTKAKNGWYYENGYKLYYKDDVLVRDVRNIIGWQSNYVARVNRQTCTVTMYAKDGSNGYIIPVVAFACTVGKSSTPTPTGTYYTAEKYRWHTLMGPSYGQYCTRIVNGIFFHSVAGYNMTPYNIHAYDYNMLGSPASHGCVRLTVRDAKWIYDNCSSGMNVTIYDSSYPGPLGKPATIKIPSSQNWDPTDPAI